MDVESLPGQRVLDLKIFQPGGSMVRNFQLLLGWASSTNPSIVLYDPAVTATLAPPGEYNWITLAFFVALAHVRFAVPWNGSVSIGPQVAGLWNKLGPDFEFLILPLRYPFIISRLSSDAMLLLGFDSITGTKLPESRGWIKTHRVRRSRKLRSNWIPFKFTICKVLE